MCMNQPPHTHPRYDQVMRTNIVIDDQLMSQALRLSGLTTKRALVHRALEEYVRNHSQRDLLDLFASMTDVDYDPAMLADYDAQRISRSSPRKVHGLLAA